uniref:Uncharacterized protein n=1 Tax=Panagrolaimus superbus TaxID=310955 RepID=A0A914YK12_9BILA
MVLNIGIFPFWGNVSTYDTETETFSKFDITPVKEEDSRNADSMFKEIISKVDKPVGCVCISLGYSYLNDIRKNFIKSANQSGIEKIKIISGKQARFIGMLEKSGIRPVESEVIWIIAVWENNIICDVWQKVGNSCVYKVNYGQSKTNEGKAASPTSEDFQKLFEKIGLDKQPSIIFAEGYIDEAEIAKVFPACKISVLKETKHEWTEYALIMARIMDGDNRVIECNADGVLQRTIELVFKDESLIKVEEFQPLPYQKVISVTTDESDESTLDIFERYNLVDEIELPSNTEVNVEFNIDANGIFSYKLL